MTLEIKGLDHVALGVKDLDRSIKWYEEVLGFKQFKDNAWGAFPVFLISSSDRTGLALFPNKTGNPVSMPGDRQSGLPHFAFRVDSANFGRAQDHLAALSIRFDFQDHHNAHSIYFRDPDDYCIEITTYEV